MDKHYLSMLVANKAGVLSRISGLIARRGYNIDSLSVCATEDPEYSRMTIELKADERTFKQIEAQLAKQVEVVKHVELRENDSVLRELLLIKIACDKALLPEIADLTTIYKAKTVDISATSITLELTGRADKLDSFIDMLRPYGILEMARSGLSALERGGSCLKESN